MEGQRRPLGIWIIVILELVSVGITFLDVALGIRLVDTGFQRLMKSQPWLQTVGLVWGLLVVVASLWLFSLRRRGWALMMLLVGLSLTANLVIWWFQPEDAQWVRMGLGVVAAFYLNSSAVRRLFIKRHEVSRITLIEQPAS